MKARAPWMGVLFLVLLAALIWPQSTIAQQLRHTPAPVNLGPTINLMLNVGRYPPGFLEEQQSVFDP